MLLSQQAEILFEGKVLSAAELAALFPKPQVLATLASQGILTPASAGKLRVSFVGVAVVGGRSFQILPKIFSGSSVNVSVAMRQVIRALRRYAKWKPKHHPAAPHLDPVSQETDLNALAIADWLIQDYMSHGVYRRFRDREEINGPGQIGWRRTVDRIMPTMTSGRPVYFDFVTKSVSRDHGHFVSRLHKQILETASQSYGHLLGYPPITLDHEPLEPIRDTSNRAFFQARIKQEMQESYSDRSIRLLPMMLAWLSAFERAKDVGFSAYGTTAFPFVWEDACAIALGNERERWLGYIPRPLWRSVNGIEKAADTFEPDIVTRIRHDDEEHLLIADAKYYQLIMPPKLNNQPGVNDIAKQLWYERCLATAAVNNGLTRSHNIFVVPGPEREDCFWSDGQVSLQGLPETTVMIKRLSGLKALERYADGIALDRSRVREVVLAS